MSVLRLSLGVNFFLVLKELIFPRRRLKLDWSFEHTAQQVHYILRCPCVSLRAHFPWLASELLNGVWLHVQRFNNFDLHGFSQRPSTCDVFFARAPFLRRVNLWIFNFWPDDQSNDSHSHRKWTENRLDRTEEFPFDPRDSQTNWKMISKYNICVLAMHHFTQWV